MLDLNWSYATSPSAKGVAIGAKIPDNFLDIAKSPFYISMIWIIPLYLSTTREVLILVGLRLGDRDAWKP
jgi:hypothetical protein